MLSKYVVISRPTDEQRKCYNNLPDHWEEEAFFYDEPLAFEHLEWVNKLRKGERDFLLFVMYVPEVRGKYDDLDDDIPW